MIPNQKIIAKEFLEMAKAYIGNDNEIGKSTQFALFSIAHSLLGLNEQDEKSEEAPGEILDPNGLQIDPNLELTKEQIKEWAEHLYTVCPYCGASLENLNYQEELVVDGDWYQLVSCCKCKKRWNEVYSLYRMESV